ncbi:hypothetical protein [Vreelandella zhaodongensis]|jgi:hypothetical protein|uniref:Uncharacterized protein n=1 Tax=Vreelandella zhaodongensis TaxID=1176240 RepID=A0ABX2STR2_VREZH|nr:hypothetical protein [Halomonas zhaodongensis]NYS45516.1 hypothetical protein [Halomonas zhaodongensis]
MTLSPEKEKLCDDLVVVMEKLSDLLKASGEDPLEYRGIEKVKNIANSCDPIGVKKIARHLDGDIRVIYDNRASSDEIEKQFEQAYAIADQL